MKYLDPKADLTFKKIFGNHPARLISLLNALLPLSDEEQIRKIKYLPTELVPQLEGGKNTIVDVLCTDVRGRKFCVEMQMEWSDAFQQRVLFNASKLYVSQAKKGGKYSELQPVYSLNLVNDIFTHDTPDFIHNYRIVHDKDSNKVIEGLHFTFIELPKFTPHSIADSHSARNDELFRPVQIESILTVRLKRAEGPKTPSPRRVGLTCETWITYH